MEEERLPPLGRGASITAGRFEVEHGGATWTVDVDYFDLKEEVRLYRDGLLVERKGSPARFDVGDGTIEASLGTYGMHRIRLRSGGTTRNLRPVEGTGEAWRAGFARRHPAADRLIGVVAWLVLVVALVLEAPTAIGIVGDVLGFDWPYRFDLPAPVQVGIAVLGVAAAIDRALRLKANWLLDE